jgi:hypothetical protein
LKIIFHSIDEREIKEYDVSFSILEDNSNKTFLSSVSTLEDLFSTDL